MITLDEAHGRLMARLEDLQQGGARIPCRGPHSGLWISDMAKDLAEAAAACQACPALTACRDYSLAWAEEAGTWGGITPADRKLARRAIKQRNAA